MIDILINMEKHLKEYIKKYYGLTNFAYVKVNFKSRNFEIISAYDESLPVENRVRIPVLVSFYNLDKFVNEK